MKAWFVIAIVEVMDPGFSLRPMAGIHVTETEEEAKLRFIEGCMKEPGYQRHFPLTVEDYTDRMIKKMDELHGIQPEKGDRTKRRNNSTVIKLAVELALSYCRDQLGANAALLTSPRWGKVGQEQKTEIESLITDFERYYETRYHRPDPGKKT